jgi:hypothetical protein
VRAALALAGVLSSGCLCCPQAKCAHVLSVSVKTSGGAEVSSFTAKLTWATGTATVTCPADPGCVKGGADVTSGDALPTVRIDVTSGSLIGTTTVTPEYVTARDLCPGCPLATADVTVR